ncbi:MAG: hypothetical protein QXX08_07160 [Candidatus Bathyarchaeia archaeon]
MSQTDQIRVGMLKFLWELNKPVSLNEIAEKTGLTKRTAFMHLLWLRKAGHIEVSEDGFYTITETGKDVLGFPKVDLGLSQKILSKTQPDRSFYFYLGLGQPLGISSDNLTDFCEKIKTVDVKSVEFHTARGDFELWVHYLGDIELAKRLRLIKEANLNGEALRDRLYQTIKTRCDELIKKLVENA